MSSTEVDLWSNDNLLLPLSSKGEDGKWTEKDYLRVGSVKITTRFLQFDEQKQNKKKIKNMGGHRQTAFTV